MNGLGMLAGKPKYVTAVSQTDVADGWHGRPRPKGVVIDVETGRVVTDQLSMPHSPSTGPDGKLYAVAAGSLWRSTRRPATFATSCFTRASFAGWLINGYAIVTVSKPRYGKFEDMSIADELAKRNGTPMYGLVIIELATGKGVEWLKLEGDVHELSTVELMPDLKYRWTLALRRRNSRRR